MKHADKIQAEELLYLEDVIRALKSVMLFMQELVEILQALVTCRMHEC